MFETCDTPLRDEATAYVYEIEGFDLDAIDLALGLGLSADEEIGERRDRALTFVRRLSRAQMDHLGLLTGDTKRDEARAGVIAAGFIAHQEGRAVSVSFRSNHYSGRARYAGSAYAYRIVTDVVRELALAGWIALDMAPVGPNAAKGRQSTYQVTAKTVTALGESPVFELHLNDPVRMRGSDKRLMPYDDTEFTRERRRQLDRVNAMLARIDIGTRNPGIVKLPDGRWRLPGLCPDGRGGFRPRHVRSDARAVHVVHNNADWNQNGRMTGLFVQQLSAADRSSIEIDGSPVVLLDYACSHLALAYARVGLQLVGDAYAIPGWEDERKFVKRATVTAINCAKGTRKKGRAQAVNAIAHDLAVRDAKAQETEVEEAARREAGKIRPTKLHRQKARAVLKAIEKHHAPISEAFYSGMGLRFMRTEADVMLAVMLAAIDRGIPLLPVYDEFVVRVEDAADVADLMTSCWRERVGFEPLIDRRLSATARVQEAALSQNGNTLCHSYSAPLGSPSCLFVSLIVRGSACLPFSGLVGGSTIRNCFLIYGRFLHCPCRLPGELPRYMSGRFSPPNGIAAGRAGFEIPAPPKLSNEEGPGPLDRDAILG